MKYCQENVEAKSLKLRSKRLIRWTVLFVFVNIFLHIDIVEEFINSWSQETHTVASVSPVCQQGLVLSTNHSPLILTQQNHNVGLPCHPQSSCKYLRTPCFCLQASEELASDLTDGQGFPASKLWIGRASGLAPPLI